MAEEPEKASEKSQPTYSLEEVAEHNSSESLWLAIDGKVYDVTEFMEEHPGGEEVLLDVAGTNATSSFEDVGHSEDAKEMQAKYLIGNVAGPKNTEQKSSSSDRGSSDATPSSGMFSFVGIGGALLVLLLALALYVVYS